MTTSNLREQVMAVRYTTAWSEGNHIAAVRLGGPQAFEALDALCPADLFLRDGQVLHSLLLRPDATPLADLYVGRDDEEYILLADGMSAAQLFDHAARALPPTLTYELQDCAQSHMHVLLHGPYAWELLERLTTPDVIGLPYLNFFHLDDGLCFRTGQTGEYGYQLLVTRERADDFMRRLREIGPEFDLHQVGPDALAQCALENSFFNIRMPGVQTLTPIELQLQWRVSYHKEYVGSAALRTHREKGISSRVTCVLAPVALHAGDDVVCGADAAGQILAAGYSDVRGDWVGTALLRTEYAHSGLTGLQAVGPAGTVPLRTVSPPVLDNRSLHVNPQRHRFVDRADDVFPDLALPLPKT